MKAEKHYLIEKQKYNESIMYMDYNKLEGYPFKPKNSVKYNGITVNKLVIMKPSLVEKILKKKTQKRLEMFMQFIIKLIDDSNHDGTDTDPSMVRAALNELTRYKQLVQNKYRLYLDEKYTNLLNKKIEVLEQELKSKLIHLEWRQNIVSKEKAGKSR